MIKQLKCLGDTFSPKGFKDGSQAISSEGFGLHIGLVAAEGYASHGLVLPCCIDTSLEAFLTLDGCRARKLSFMKGFELLLSSSLSSSTGRASSGSSRNLPPVPKFPIIRGLLARENLGEQISHGGDESRMGAGQSSTNDAESQVDGDLSVDHSGPEVMKEELRSQVVQLKQERDELIKATNKKRAFLEEGIASRQLLLNVWTGRSASSEYSEIGGGQEQIFSAMTPVLADGHDNPLLVEPEANLGLENPNGISSFNGDQSLRSPYGADREDQPKMDLNMPLPIPRSVEPVENDHTTNDQHFSPLRKRKRARGTRQTPHQNIRQFNNDADATRSNAMAVEPAPLTDEQISTFVSSFRKQPLQTFPAGASFLTKR